jgi:hypothetical protein
MLKKITCGVLTVIISWSFVIAMPYLGAKHLLPISAKAYARDLPDTNLAPPDPIMAMEWRREAGRVEAVYLNIPSNQLSPRIELPQDPNPIIIAKYDNATATGMLAVMRIRQVGPDLQAGIFRITPENFQHHFGPHLYQFAFLNWRGGAGCDFGTMHLHDLDPPRVNNEDIIRQFNRYNLNYDIQHNMPPGLSPLPGIRLRTASEQHRINRSNFYWHQKLNTNPCWEHVALRQFDQNNDMFNNISHYGFLKLVTLAQTIHNAPVAFIATPNIRQAVETHTNNYGLLGLRRSVTTIVRYFLSPEWKVSTIKAFPDMHSDFKINATWDARGTYSFVRVQGEHTFPVDETLIHEWRDRRSGWTGLFVFLASIVLGAITGGIAGMLSKNMLALQGAAVGGIGGLVASGFNPSIHQSARFTPFVYSAYQLNPAASWSGNARIVADRTRDNWVMPDPQRTPGGVERFILKLDKRKILRAGTTANVNAMPDDRSSAIEIVRGDDPRFNTIFNEMFYKPHERLQRHVYPFIHDQRGVTIPTPVR